MPPEYLPRFSCRVRAIRVYPSLHINSATFSASRCLCPRTLHRDVGDRSLRQPNGKYRSTMDGGGSTFDVLEHTDPTAEACPRCQLRVRLIHHNTKRSRAGQQGVAASRAAPSRHLYSRNGPHSGRRRSSDGWQPPSTCRLSLP